MTATDLVKFLEPQLKYLANTSIKGMEKEDIKQELVMMVLEDIKKNPDFLDPTYKEGWWFKRLKWHMLNLKEKEQRDPVNRSVRFEAFEKKGKNAKRK